MTELTQKTCRACEGGVTPMKPDEQKEMLKEIPEWQLKELKASEVGGVKEGELTLS